MKSCINSKNSSSRRRDTGCVHIKRVPATRYILYIYTVINWCSNLYSLAMQATPIKGRGSVSNRTSRFEALCREPFDDDWATDDHDAAPKPATTVSVETARSIISRNDSPDLYFEQSINPYRGCKHGCIYCYARPTHAYLNHSPGLDFEKR